MNLSLELAASLIEDAAPDFSKHVAVVRKAAKSAGLYIGDDGVTATLLNKIADALHANDTKTARTLFKTFDRDSWDLITDPNVIKFLRAKAEGLSEDLDDALDEAADDLVAQVVRWIQDEGDGDYSPGGCHAVATTDEVAKGLRLDPRKAYNALAKAAKQGLVLKREMRKHPSGGDTYSQKDKAIGWRLWEVKLRPEQCE